MRTIGNILWFILGGWLAGLLWCLFGLISFISIICIPWGWACFTIARLSFFPFGKVVVNREIIRGQHDIGTGFLGMLGNIVWFVFGGVWLVLVHLMAAVCMFITIIGIPFGLQHVKLAQLALAPIGKSVISS